MPYSFDDVKKMTSVDAICGEINPKFFKLPIVSFIRSLQPFERLSMDFKGPLFSKTNNHYIFSVVYEFLQFSFFFSCRSRTIILCLRSLFNLFGFPAIVNSDNAKCFVSKKIKKFLNERRIASTFSSVYCITLVVILNANVLMA